MKKITKQKILALIICCLGNFLPVYAQPSLQTTLDKDQILIGSQIKLKVQASFQPAAYFVRWITSPDSLLHFELINKSKIDSIFVDEKLTGLAQTFTLTSFDSGRWALPAFNVKFNPANGDSTINLYSDSLLVAVTFQRDSTTALRDIKTIREVTAEDYFWYWVAGGVAVLLLLAGIAWWYFRKKKGKPFIKFRSPLTAYQQAMEELDKLAALNLADAVDIKLYHTCLTETLKQYLFAKAGVDIAGKTTADLLILLKDNSIDSELLSKTAAALRRGDAVKFAKYLPEQQESEVSMQTVKQVIDTVEKYTIQTKQ